MRHAFHWRVARAMDGAVDRTHTCPTDKLPLWKQGVRHVVPHWLLTRSRPQYILRLLPAKRNNGSSTGTPRTMCTLAATSRYDVE